MRYRLFPLFLACAWLTLTCSTPGPAHGGSAEASALQLEKSAAKVDSLTSALRQALDGFARYADGASAERLLEAQRAYEKALSEYLQALRNKLFVEATGDLKFVSSQSAAETQRIVRDAALAAPHRSRSDYDALLADARRLLGAPDHDPAQAAATRRLGRLLGASILAKSGPSVAMPTLVTGRPEVRNAGGPATPPLAASADVDETLARGLTPAIIQPLQDTTLYDIPAAPNAPLPARMETATAAPSPSVSGPCWLASPATAPNFQTGDDQ